MVIDAGRDDEEVTDGNMMCGCAYANQAATSGT